MNGCPARGTSSATVSRSARGGGPISESAEGLPTIRAARLPAAAHAAEQQATQSAVAVAARGGLWFESIESRAPAYREVGHVAGRRVGLERGVVDLAEAVTLVVARRA